MQTGKRYGVSVGPGDPELMTLKAVRCMQNCPVIATLRTNDKKSFALAIASGAVDLSGKQIVPMTRDLETLSSGYARAASSIATHLDGGYVAMLNLGDAFVIRIEGCDCFL